MTRAHVSNVYVLPLDLVVDVSYLVVKVRTRHSFLQSSYNVAADTVVQATGNCFMWKEWVRKNWITIAVIADCYRNPVFSNPFRPHETISCSLYACVCCFTGGSYVST